MTAPKLLPGPDGKGRAREPVAHRRSDLPGTLTVDLEDGTTLVATRPQDDLFETIMTALIGFGPGRLTTRLTHESRSYVAVADIDVRVVHKQIAQKMVEVTELVDLTHQPEPEQPAPPSEPPLRYA